MQGAQVDQSPTAFSVGMRKGHLPSSLVQVTGRSRGSVRGQAPGGAPLWAREGPGWGGAALEGVPEREAPGQARAVCDAFCLPSGAITVRSAEGLDFEASPRLRLVLQAESGGAFAFSVLTLTLQDANDNAPRFLQPHYVAFLPESRPLEGPLLQVWDVMGRWGGRAGRTSLWPA